MKLLHLKVVLAAIDSDESALETVRAARELASAAGARLQVVHAIPPVKRDDQVVHAAAAEDGANVVRRLLDRSDLGRADVAIEVVAGEPTHVIRSLADKIGADVIVLGEHRGRQTRSQGIGSTALGVVTNSWAPCLVLPKPMRLPLANVLVPVDLSTTARGALLVALSWASALRKTQKVREGPVGESAALTALLVEGKKGAASEQALDEELNQLRRDAGSWAGVGVRGVVVTNRDIPQAIADYAGEHRSDLIVLGTRGLGSEAVGRLGSVALGVIRRLDAPVLLVPPAVWRMAEDTENVRGRGESL